MATSQRSNIDAAARQLANKFGLKVRGRESWNSAGERLVRWHLQNDAGEVTHELQIACGDGAAFGWQGWASSVWLFQQNEGWREQLCSATLVEATLRLGRRAATALTYTRLSEWATQYRVSA